MKAIKINCYANGVLLISIHDVLIKYILLIILAKLFFVKKLCIFILKIYLSLISWK